MNCIQIPAIWSERILQIPYITAADIDLKMKSKNTIKNSKQKKWFDFDIQNFWKIWNTWLNLSANPLITVNF